MPNRPVRNFNYSKPLVAMLTLKARPGRRLCRITADTFTVLPLGRIVQEELNTITEHYAQFKIGQYQIMPDHLHMMAHVTRLLPGGVTLREVIRGYKLGVNRRAESEIGRNSAPVFEKGLYDSLVFNEKQLQREVKYIRDNVRRYRRLLANPGLFRSASRFMRLADGTPLWGYGNVALAQHPRRVLVQFSRRCEESDWPLVGSSLSWYLEQGYVMVSPFISGFEQRVLQATAAKRGRAIRVTHRSFGERYKPSGILFDMCADGDLLEVAVPTKLPFGTELDRATCLRLNAVAEELSTNRWKEMRTPHELPF